MRGGREQAELQVVRSAHSAKGADGNSKGRWRCWCSRAPPPANLLSRPPSSTSSSSPSSSTSSPSSRSSPTSSPKTPALSPLPSKLHGYASPAAPASVHPCRLCRNDLSPCLPPCYSPSIYIYTYI
ncbi:hypothetical protein TB2_019439 [Malus domestica]